MNHTYMTDQIMELLNCGKATAESIERLWQLVGVQGVTGIEKVPDQGYHILKLTAEREETYYVFVGRNLSVKQIRSGSKDGACIYRAME